MGNGSNDTKICPPEGECKPIIREGRPINMKIGQIPPANPDMPTNIREICKRNQLDGKKCRRRYLQPFSKNSRRISTKILESSSTQPSILLNKLLTTASEKVPVKNGISDSERLFQPGPLIDTGMHLNQTK